MTKLRVALYQERLEASPLSGWVGLLPELYLVPDRSGSRAEKPGSQPRLPNENVPLVWAQSLYILGQLLQTGLLKPGDIDPLGRHLRVGERRYPVVQVALLAEDKALQAELDTYGLPTQVLEEIDPVQVYPASELSHIYAEIGKNSTSWS
jgi:phosphorylase kinase alpha/beta subunit